MREKIKNIIGKALDRLPKLATTSAAMKYISWYAVFVMLCSGVYLAMILAEWYVTGHPAISEMRLFISTMTGGAVVAAIGFIARYLVDLDGDGIPDELKKGETHDTRRNP